MLNGKPTTGARILRKRIRCRYFTIRGKDVSILPAMHRIIFAQRELVSAKVPIYAVLMTDAIMLVIDGKLLFTISTAGTASQEGGGIKGGRMGSLHHIRYRSGQGQGIIGITLVVELFCQPTQ
jgi:hypothetical protein